VIVYAAVPTLFAADGSVADAANRALYAHVCDIVDGLFVAGTTGEFPALEDAERLSLVSSALEVAGPDRVIAHIGAASARQAARLAASAVALGVRRVAAITPYYLAATPAELTDHYLRIRDAVPGDIELYGYIFAERTGVRVPPPLFAVVAGAAGLAGAKVSGAAAASLADYVAAAPGLRFFSGDDSDPARSARWGATGVISARSAAYPEVFAALAAALRDDPGDGAGVARGQEALDRIVGLGASIGRVKRAIALRGFGTDTARMTVEPPDEATAEAIAAEVAMLPRVAAARS
jgi:4-hydroxy-tetrahydrodipicolinate synthase